VDLTEAPAEVIDVAPESTEAPVEEETQAPFVAAEGSPFQCASPGIVASSEDCRKFWLCKEEEEGNRVLESLLYRCPPGYLFSTVIVRCAKQEEVSCPLDQPSEADFRGVNTIQLTVNQLDDFFARWA